MGQEKKDSTGIVIREWPPVMPIKQASKELGVSEMTMYELINDGQIRSLKIASRRHVVSQSLLSYIDRQAKASQPRDPRISKMHAAKAAKRATRASRPRLVPKAPK